MKIIKNNQKGLILLAALVTPGGFIALGVWKAYELYKKQQEEKARLEEVRAKEHTQKFIDSLKED